MSLIALRRDSPFRPPNWRAQLAAVITGHPDRRLAERVRAWGDDRVEELIPTLGAGCFDPRHPFASVTALLDPANAARRLEIESRVLAGSSSVEIAARTGEAEEVIEWFVAGRFDVRDRLDARGYVVHVVLGSLPPEGDGSRPPYELLRWFGFLYGPVVVDALLEVFRNWDADRRPARGGTAAELSRRAARLRVRSAVLARMLPVDELGPLGLRTLAALTGSVRR